MTRRLYLEDAYLKRFSSRVARADGARVVLEESAFYPAGGGQPSDTGALLRGQERFSVHEVAVHGGQLVHVLDRPGPGAGEVVEGVLDWARRYRLMRMHTAAHLLSALFYRAMGARITGNQLGTEKSRMDFNLDAFDRARILAFEDEANEVAARGLPVTAEELPREKALKIPAVHRLAGVLPKNLPRLRVVSIGDFDRQADGGTHVRNTSEIGRIRFLKLENKGAANRRLYFTVEDGEK